MSEHIVIVGGGHGGAQLCAALRINGFSGEITLVSKEEVLPYHRPPLSKAFLRGDAIDTQIIKPKSFYDDNNIRLMLGRTVFSINRTSHEIELSDNSVLEYSNLVLATGSKARKLQIPGSNTAGIHYLKTAEDALSLRSALDSASRISVVGGGFIGLEAAATFLKLGKKVTVFEAGDRLLGRAVSPEISQWFLDKHGKAGIDFVLEAEISEFNTASGRVSAVICNGRVTGADIVVIGIGVVSNCELAEAAGISCKNGVLVDPHMRTSDPDILAIGDCVAFEHWQTGTLLRLESVQNANDQARNAALTLTGQEESYTVVPWFWSDQGEDKLQIVGLSGAADRRVVKKNLQNNQISVFHFEQSKLMAIDTVNSPAEHMLGRKLLAKGLSPLPEDLKHPEFNLRNML